MSEVKQERKPHKSVVLIMLLGILALTVYLLYRLFGDFFVNLVHLLEHGSQEEIMDFLGSQPKAEGMLSIFLLSMLQVISIFIPGMAIHIAGAVVLGWWRAFLSSWTGFVTGNVLVFSVARIFGKSLTDAVAGKKENWLARQMNKADPAFVTALGFLVPGVPNGILPYIASTTKLKLSEYAAATAVSSWVQILLNCVAAHFLVRGQYIAMIMTFIIEVVILVVVATNREKILNMRRN